MANINISIPDGQVSRVVNAIASEYDYDTRKIGEETKIQFSKRMLIEDFIIKTVKRAEIGNAVDNQTSAISADVDTNVDIT